MSPELESLFHARYPRLFAQRHLPLEQSAMSLGCACGDGWFILLDTLFDRLQWWCDTYDAPQVELQQVKNKCGTLRVHLQGAGPEQRGMVEMARAMSEHICDVCGRVHRHAPCDRSSVIRCNEDCAGSSEANTRG